MNKKKKIKVLILCAVLLIGMLGIVLSVQNEKQQKIEFIACENATTVKLKVDEKEEYIRLLGVVAPSTIERDGKKVKAYTCDLFEQAKDIRLEFEEEQLVDNFGVKLAWVFVEQEFVQEKLVKKGYVNVTRLYGDYPYVEKLKKELQKAKEKKIGIWKI